MKIQVGVIGAGYWGSKLIEEYFKLEKERDNIELVGIADVIPQNRELARKYGVSVTDDYKKLLSKVNAVHIATPNETHYGIAKRALMSGKNTLVEKPMTKSSEEAAELIELAEQNKLTLQVGHVFRFDNSVKKLRDYMRAGQLGDIYAAKLSWTTSQFPLPPERDIIFDLGPHPIDILNFVYDEWPERVYTVAESYVRNKEGLEEWASLTLEFPHKKNATIELSWINPIEKKREIQINGSFATAVVDTVKQEMRLYRDKRIKIPVEKNNTIRDEISHFADVIEKNIASTNSGQIGSRNIEVLEALRKSLEIRAPLELRHAKLDIGKYSLIIGGNIGEDTKIGNHATIRECTIGMNCDIRNNADLYRCKIGDGTKIETHVIIEGGAEIGRNVVIKPGVFVPTGVTIEDNAFIGANVNFANDKFPRAGKSDWKLIKTYVRKGASIGSGANILPGVTIGEYSMVGMGAVVTNDVPAKTTVIGNPAKVCVTQE